MPPGCSCRVHEPAGAAPRPASSNASRNAPKVDEVGTSLSATRRSGTIFLIPSPRGEVGAHMRAGWGDFCAPDTHPTRRALRARTPPHRGDEWSLMQRSANHTRHPGESRGPVPRGRAEESFLFGAQTRARWIPASAGMTVAWIARRKVTATVRMRQLATRRRLRPSAPASPLNPRRSTMQETRVGRQASLTLANRQWPRRRSRMILLVLNEDRLERFLRPEFRRAYFSQAGGVPI